jgi:hypothetical protein
MKKISAFIGVLLIAGILLMVHSQDKKGCEKKRSVAQKPDSTVVKDTVDHFMPEFPVVDTAAVADTTAKKKEKEGCKK